MASLTIYLDDDTLSRVEQAARREKVSLSRWAREHLAEAAMEKRGWPEGYFDLFGAIQDETFVEPPELSLADDGTRLDFN